MDGDRFHIARFMKMVTELQATMTEFLDQFYNHQRWHENHAQQR
jgi:hypothetical protein